MSESSPAPVDRLPGLALPLVGGGTVCLSDLAGQRHLVFMWASW